VLTLEVQEYGELIGILLPSLFLHLLKLHLVLQQRMLPQLHLLLTSNGLLFSMLQVTYLRFPQEQALRLMLTVYYLKQL